MLEVAATFYFIQRFNLVFNPIAVYVEKNEIRMAHCLKLHLRAFCRLIFHASKPHAIGPQPLTHRQRTYCPLWRVIYVLLFFFALFRSP